MNTQKKVFVTGSTGFIGSILVEKLLQQGFSVRALVRTIPPNREHPENLEYLPGDITDIESLRRGMSGCQRVFHLAAYAKNWAKNLNTFSEVNIGGTRNVFQVAKELNAERLVWTSSIVTLGFTESGVVGNESMMRQSVCFTEYERTKTKMEREAAKWVADGLPLVIVNPTRVFGPGVLSESNSVTLLIADFRRGRFPFLLNWGKNVANYGFVNDVADGHLLAMEKGRIGERYILGGENISLRDLFGTVEKIDGKKHFKISVYYFTPLLAAKFFELRAKYWGIYPPITPGWIRTFVVDWAFSCEKARQELGYSVTPLEEALKKTCAWLDKKD